MQGATKCTTLHSGALQAARSRHACALQASNKRCSPWGSAVAGDLLQGTTLSSSPLHELSEPCWHPALLRPPDVTADALWSWHPTPNPHCPASNSLQPCGQPPDAADGTLHPPFGFPNHQMLLLACSRLRSTKSSSAPCPIISALLHSLAHSPLALLLLAPCIPLPHSPGVPTPACMLAVPDTAL